MIGLTVTPPMTRRPPEQARASSILALYDEAVATCDAGALARLRTELDARDGLGPLWAGGRALFRTSTPTGIAGTFNNWSPTALISQPLFGTDLVLAVAPVRSGFHQYKLVKDGVWSLDRANPAFAYDDFSGNPDGKNSVLNTPDSGRGHILLLDRVCSEALGNCRDVTAYIPPGYHAPDAAERRYPVLFMHDGKNVWDDHDCCFGHTGWEINLTLDAEIAAGRVAPVIVIAADQSDERGSEYAFSLQDAFMSFQVDELQPRALAKVRGNGEVYVAGSSFGGLVSLELAFAYPQTYKGVASLSGAFWPTSLADRLRSIGKRPMAIYLDSGGSPQTNSDGAADSIEVRDVMYRLGWRPSCTRSLDALCYHWEPNAPHNELAWKDRAWRFLRFLLAP
jgi:predicted alpha/beta superfamily hydrolase